MVGTAEVCDETAADRQRLIPVARALVPVAAFVVWVVVVCVGRSVYDFANPTAAAISATDLHAYRDVLTRLPRNLNVFFFVLLFLISAIGPGALLLMPLRLTWRDEAERAIFALATGLILYTFGILTVGSAGFLRRNVCLMIVGAGLCCTGWYAVGVYRRGAARRAAGTGGARCDLRSRLRAGVPGSLLSVGLTVVLIAFLYVALLGALGPEIGGDARWYHLGAAHSYVVHGGFYNMVRETRMAAVAFDQYQSALYAMLDAVGGLIAAKLLHYSDGLLVALALIVFCRVHFHSVRLGLVAAIIFISTPLITWSMGTANNDLQLALYGLLSLHAFLRWRQEPTNPRWLVVIGLLSGYAIGSKPIGACSFAALLVGIVCIGYPRFRQADPRAAVRRVAGAVAVAGGVALLGCLPWLVRSAVETGNPTFPFLNGIFHSPYWNARASESINAVYRADGRTRTLAHILALPFDTVTHNNRYVTVIGPLFLLQLPVVVAVALRPRTSAGALVRLLLGYAVCFMVVWFASGALDVRYAIALLPMGAVLLAVPLTMRPWQGWDGRLLSVALAAVTIGVTALNFQPLVSYQSPTAVGRVAVSWPYLYDGVSADRLPAVNSPMIRYINAHLSPARDKVYDNASLMEFAADSDITIFNGRGYEGPGNLGEWNLFSPDAPAHLVAEHCTYVALSPLFMEKLVSMPVWNYLEETYRVPGDGETLYRVRDTPLPYRLTVGTGWQADPGSAVGRDARWLTAEGQLLLTTTAPAVRLTFEATPYAKPGTLEVRRNNGVLVQTVSLPTPDRSVPVSLDLYGLDPGLNILDLRALDGCTRRSDVSTSKDTTCISMNIGRVVVTPF